VLVALLAIVSVAGVLAQAPPRNLHLVQGHWTAWEPPIEFPQGAELYVIEPGDTLWDLAQRHYGDPYLWPQLWERNRYILDAHWIYPGDPLVLGIQATPIEEIAALPGDSTPPPPVESAAPPDDEIRLERFSGPPVALGSESDVACSGYIGALDESFPLTIAGSEYEGLSPRLRQAGSTSSKAKKQVQGLYGRVDTVKYDLSTGDIVYLSGGARTGLYPGELYTVVARGEKVVHPITDEVVGRYYHYLGRVRVLTAQEDGSIAEIVQSCAPITVGDALAPFQEEPVPLGRRGPSPPVNDPLSVEALAQAPAIIQSVDDLVSLGQDHMVFIDRGSDSVAPGDLFTIYRPSRVGQPPVVIGELAVLTVSDRAALARILESRYVVYLGDRLGPREP
jgi:hypothetical protein